MLSVKKSVVVILTWNARTPNDYNKSIVKQGDHADHEEHKEIPQYFSGSQRQGPRHI